MHLELWSSENQSFKYLFILVTDALFAITIKLHLELFTLLPLCGQISAHDKMMIH